MAVLEKIRVRFGVFITALIGLALISFVIDVNTLQTVISMFSSRYDVGAVAGKSISYQDYQKKVDYYSAVNQMIIGANSLSEAMQERVREQAWQAYFQEYALNAEYEKCGLNISAEELTDLIRGRYVSPVLYNDPVFTDETGEFSRAAVVNFVQSINSDPSGQRAMYWNYVEQRMKDAQLAEKYIALLGQSDYLNVLQLKDAVNSRNTIADISYIVQPLGFTADTSIRATEADLTAYYKANRKNFEQETSRDVEYVSFPIDPSDEDIRHTEEDADNIFEEFKTADDLKQFVTFNSDHPFDDRFYKKGELTEKLDSFAFNATLKSILPVYREDNTYIMARVAAIRNMPDSVQVRHILISQQGRTKDAVNKTADSLLTLLERGGNFGYLAQQYSIDQVANRTEGDLGWIKQGSLISAMKNFEDTCFIVPRNKYFKVEGNYGVHVAQVTERSAEYKKVKLAVVEKVAEAGKITIQSLFTQANELAALSLNNYNEFVRLSNEKGYIRVPAYKIRESDKSVSVFANARELVRWVYEAKDHEVSATLNLNNEYFLVAAVTEIREAGIAPFEQVRVDVEQIVRREKQAEMYAQRIKEAMNGASDLEAVAEKLNVTVEKALDVSFGNASIAGIGTEPKLEGAIAGAAVNTVSGPVKGINGVYAFTVDTRETGSAYTEEDEKMRRRLDYTQYRMFDFISVLEKTKNVEDWRFRYF
ncbi:MAG: SurA N-terminal domain-containing protein [Prevotellaceae bacterium]|jgi:peptidyl-prolyl cis-trans isomerase D|nr:SurA N-terminal domain-containing protein [Prevotellaceae bacterium]